MKKKSLVFTILLSIAGIVFCAGKLAVKQENFHAYSYYGTQYGYAYAKIENTGDKPIKVNAGVLEVYNENGDAITSTDWMYSFASNLRPGEYTYVRLAAQIKDETETVGDYSLTVTGKSDNTIMQRFPCTTDLALNFISGYWTHNYMYASVTNNTTETIFGIRVVFALLDADGNILDIDSDGSDIGLAPGSTMVFRKEISSPAMDYFTANGFQPTKVDAVAYLSN